MNNDFKSFKKVIVPVKHRFFGEDSVRGVEAFLTEFEPNSIISKGLYRMWCNNNIIGE